ncbi:MAG: Hpt domain-containing protein, partial [Lachnospiraceae bacterium]|nr:Hpt domain-containing protein [Lachnospiraceae bacterium]
EIPELERVLRRVLPESAVTFEKIVTEKPGRAVKAAAEKPAAEKPAAEGSGAGSDAVGKDGYGDKDAYRALREAGINTEAGLEYCQRDRELYQELLEQYVKEAPGKQEKLDQCFRNADFKNYEIYVHALKSTSKTIGASDLSGKALRLENMAKEGGEGITEALHEEMMEQYKKTAAMIAKAVDPESAAAENGSAGPRVLEFSPTEEKKKPTILEFAPEGSSGGRDS